MFRFALLPLMAEAATAQQMGDGSSWEAFKAKYGKVYTSDEEEHRQTYEANMQWAVENSNDEVQFGENQFADLTTEQYRVAASLGYKDMFARVPHVGVHEWNGEELASCVDWTEEGAVTPVKDQGLCGSCWAFSTTGVIEGMWPLMTGTRVELSEQQLVDCCTQSEGCSGQQQLHADFGCADELDWATEDSYPYTARDGTCKTSGFDVAIPKGSLSVTGYKSVPKSTAGLKSALNQFPISVAVEADQMAFQMYSGGILSSGCGTTLDHGALAVGYCDGFFKVKNSWGVSWGESGYVRISDEGNTCGILSDASYPTISASMSV